MEHSNTDLRNFKDFLQLYNQMSETCFYRCVDNMTTRQLNPSEEACINCCSSKFINVNQKVMSLYVAAQSNLVNKKVEESMMVNSTKEDNNAEETNAPASAKL